MTKFVEPVLESEITLQKKQRIANECEEHVSTNCLGCAAYLVCERHAEVWDH
ncbi:hypothetical protein [Vibrio sp. 10N.261.46.A3]|uniref:hypothetical protein n=1 Tax=Vibrio sp. 10N.261.46.A3 TaxID=3229658 RepID=UPI00355343D0